MLLSDFDYYLPPELIAETPVSPRDSARMLHVSDVLHDRHVRDLSQLLRAGDVMVFNDSKVIPARLYGHKDGHIGRIEILLHKMLRDGVWEAWAKPAKRIPIGSKIIFADDFAAHVIDKTEAGFVHIDFSSTQMIVFEKLQKYGLPPLPPYIHRKTRQEDVQTYQTVYANEEGSVAAPTAGLHFTQELLERIKSIGVKLTYVTLHVGAGTFKPVTVENVSDHIMHSEWGEIDPDTAKLITEVRKSGGRVITIGTTSTRLVETATDVHGVTHAYCGDTNLFITPGYKFKGIHAMMTNFHLPKSTLLMLVSALMGRDKMLKAYNHAIKQKYRFYSYGDACFLEPSFSSNSAA